MAARISGAIRSKGLSLRDAFGLFDHDSDGVLSPAELYGGMNWLGIHLSPKQVRELFTVVDANTDGTITMAEFKKGLALTDEPDEPPENADMIKIINKIMPMPVDDEEGQKVQGPLELRHKIYRRFEIKVMEVSELEMVWNSRGSMTHNKGSIHKRADGWISTSMRDLEFSVGQYLSGSLTANFPRGAKTLVLCDRSVQFYEATKFGQKLLRRVCPNPVRYRLEWQMTRGEKALYVWRPVPKSSAFVALGMVATTTEDPPELKAVRTVPRAWCTPVAEEPREVWDSTGTGGRAAKLWAVGSLGLMQVGSGADYPTEMYELKATKFRVKDLTDLEPLEDQLKIT